MMFVSFLDHLRFKQLYNILSSFMTVFESQAMTIIP